MADRAILTDRIVGAYAVLAVVALLFPGRAPAWPLLLAAHAGLLALSLGAAKLRAGGRARRIVGDWYPLLLLPLLYTETEILNAGVWGGRFFDPLIIALEERVFGGQPSTTFGRAAPWPVLSEFLHASYLSYYLIIYLPPLALYLRGDREDYRTMLRPLVAAFLLHYLVFIYFPVQGPRYLFPVPGGAIAEWPMYRLAHAILESGSSRGAAFPSSHMAISVVQTISAFRFLPRAAPWLLVATIGLGFGAVYGGVHYAVDMVAGALTGLLIGLAFLQLDRRRGP